MRLTQPSSNFKGYELQEWWRDTQKLIGQRGQFDYQVDVSTITPTYGISVVTFASTNTSNVDMSLGENETTVFLLNPGTISLPQAALYPAKDYYFIAYRNTNITWTGKSLVVAPYPGEYIHYESNNLTLLNLADYSQQSIRLISDGINNWIIVP